MYVNLKFKMVNSIKALDCVFGVFVIGMLLLSGCDSREIKERDYIVTLKDSKTVIGDKQVDVLAWYNNTGVYVLVYDRIDESNVRREKLGILPTAEAKINVNETKVVYGIKITVKEVTIEVNKETYAILTMGLSSG